MQRIRGFALAVVAGVTLAVAPHAGAQTFGSVHAAPNPGNSPDDVNDVVAGCSWKRATQVEYLANTPSLVRTRYKEGIGADCGIFTTGATETQNSDYTLSFTVTAPGAYILHISASLNGAFTQKNDLADGGGFEDLTAVTGTQTGGTLVAGALGISDPGILTTAGPNNGDVSNVGFHVTSTADIRATSNGAPHTHSLRYTWSGSARSDGGLGGGDESAVRLGLATTFALSDYQVGQYPGYGGRTDTADGKFLSVSIESLCGNGVIDGAAGEQCDAGIVNGTSTSCCTSTCQFRAAGQQCRPAIGVCDAAESCTGTSGDCPADGWLATSVVCRPSAGECDLADHCPGTGPNCGPDDKVPTETPCTSDGNPCTIDWCNGVLNKCQHPAGNAGATCRAAAGVCDLAETCNGTSDACPADAKKAAGTTCRAAAGVCDVAETCDGTASGCPADALAPAGTVCRPSAGACDLAETCTGSSAACPADTGAPDADGDGVCDAQDNCDAVPNAGQGDADGDGVGDACDLCTNPLAASTTKTKLQLSKLLPPPGDERFDYRGDIVVPTSPALDPITHGARVVVFDAADQPILDAVLPGGAYDRTTRVGWSTNSARTAFRYANKGLDPTHPIVRGIDKYTFKLSSKVPGLVSFQVGGKNASYAFPTNQVPVRAVVVLEGALGLHNQCGDSRFAGIPPAPSCAFVGKGSTLRCK